MYNLRQLFALVVVLVALSMPALAGNIETPPAPVPPPASAPATSEPAADGNLETPPAAVIYYDAALRVLISVVNLI